MNRRKFITIVGAAAGTVAGPSALAADWARKIPDLEISNATDILSLLDEDGSAIAMSAIKFEPVSKGIQRASCPIDITVIRDGLATESLLTDDQGIDFVRGTFLFAAHQWPMRLFAGDVIRINDLSIHLL